MSIGTRPKGLRHDRYDNGEVSETVGASFTFGQRYGARFIVHLGDFSRDPAIVLFQMGGYVSFWRD